jgi:AraC-like DNA-binding protein
MPERGARVAVPPSVLLYAPRERARGAGRAAFPRRRARLAVVRSAEEFAAAFRAGLVDAALVDVGALTDDTWRAARLAREFPSVPFFALAPCRAADGPAVAQCAALDFVDVLVDGIDDEAMRDLVAPHLFSRRFADALRDPPPALDLTSPTQVDAWRCVVAHAGRLVRTSALATALGVTREHLSRTFAAGGAPNLKRVIDLVRLLAAAELAKNPGYDVRDVARVLGFASSSHLSSTAQRVVGTRPASLARLRTVDLVERFAQGRGRSRPGEGREAE